VSFTLFDKTYALSCGVIQRKKGGPFTIKARVQCTSDPTLNRDAFEVLGIQLDETLADVQVARVHRKQHPAIDNRHQKSGKHREGCKKTVQWQQRKQVVRARDGRHQLDPRRHHQRLQMPPHGVGSARTTDRPTRGSRWSSVSFSIYTLVGMRRHRCVTGLGFRSDLGRVVWTALQQMTRWDGYAVAQFMFKVDSITPPFPLHIHTSSTHHCFL
jgi:hypothetical protein